MILGVLCVLGGIGKEERLVRVDRLEKSKGIENF